MSNHSARKTCLSSLLSNKVHPIIASQLSGHNNLNSLGSYHTVSNEQQQMMCDILSSNDNDGKFIWQHPLKEIQISSQTATITSKSACISTSDNNKTINNSAKRKSMLFSSGQFDSMFSGANLENCSFNFNFTTNHEQKHTSKHRRIISESDDE